MAAINETKFRQDMPPPGGYAKIYIQRTFPHIGSTTGRRIAFALVGLAVCGYYKFRARRASMNRWNVEQNDVKMVTTAFYLAERDRLWLKYLRQLRNEEREIMKDIPGWRVGTFYGEPIYYTLPKEMWWDPSVAELTAHTSYYKREFNANWRLDADVRGGPKWYDKYLPHWLEAM